MAKFKFTERVETGYESRTSIGGTLYITLTFNKIIDKTKYASIIDRLDHCYVTDNAKAADLNDRFYIIDKLRNVYDDIISILTEEFLHDNLKLPKSIEVKLGNESFKKKPNVTSSIVTTGDFNS